MTPRIAKKAKYERLYANGLMYLAKGEPVLAQKYLNEAAIQLKDYIAYLFDDEREQAKEWFLELCGHVKEIGKYYSTVKAQRQTEAEPLDAASDAGSFAFAKGEIPCVSFDDVVGLDAVKEQIRDMVIYPRQYRELYERFRKKEGGGILLYGPPGNGKTMIAKAIAHETESAFFPIKFSDLGSKWFGETEGRIKSLFEEARRAQSAVIFFDEIDAIATKRTESSAMDRVVAELLTQIDGINRSEGNLTILAATNKPENLDPAILRPGRFDEKIYIPLPDVKARAAMLEKRLCGVPSTVTDFAQLAALCDGFSGAELAHVCERAKQRVIRSIIEGAPNESCITPLDIREAIAHVRAS